MSETVAAGAEPASHRGVPWHKNKKLDQLLCFWSVPVFYLLFGVVFVPLSWMMPPRPPDNSMDGILAFMQSPNLLVASTVYVLTWGMAAIVTGGVYMTQLRRMSVSPVLRYCFFIGQTAGAIVGALFPMFCFGLGAFRPGYDPEILAMLYDFGYLAFIGSLGCFCLPWMTLALSILLDRNRIIPKWVGYWTVWQYVTELLVASCWIAKTGPFAWNGLLAFWFNMCIFVPWQFIIYFYIYKAIKHQPEAELDNVRFSARAAQA